MTEVQVKSSAGSPYKQEIKAGQHTFTADAPKDLGGSGAGPEPHELMLSALGACTSITIQMYAQRKGWDVKNVTVKLKEEYVEDPNNQGKMAKITREIDVEGELTQEQIDGLKAIADKCPIHKLLNGSKQILTNIHHNQIA